jgi:putative membrane protein
MVHQVGWVNLKLYAMKQIMVLLLFAASTIRAAYAQAPDPDTTARHFIIMASIGNLEEVNEGKLAAHKATRSDIKSFGEMMVTDHSRLQQKLLKLAKAKGIQIPSAATDTPPEDIKMAGTSGDDFDRMYIHAMVAGHGSTVMMFQNYAITGKDPDVKAFAEQALPTLKEHLSEVKALDEKYKNLTAK